jgi:putative oxidoreductase
MNTDSNIMARYFRWFVPSTSFFQSLLLLVLRLYWGWGFFLTGKGKLMDLEKVTAFFQSLGIPLPHAQAMLVGATECFGGLLLLAGFCSRLISIPLTILLTVAYLTADLDRVKMIFSDPDKFLTADQFLFLFVVVIVFAFGPGKFSIDWLIKRRVAPPPSEGA